MKTNTDTTSSASSALRQTGNDPLEALGFERVPGFGRFVWKGEIGGRATEISLVKISKSNPDSMGRRIPLGFRLSIMMATTLSMWLYLVPASFVERPWVRWLYRFKRLAVSSIPDPALADFRVASNDPEWTLRWLLDGDSLEQIHALLTDKRGSGPLPGLHTDPEQLHYGSRLLELEEIEPAWVVATMERMQRLADRLEQLPAPAQPAKLNRLQLIGRKHPVLLGAVLFGGILAGLLVTVLGLLLLFFQVF